MDSDERMMMRERQSLLMYRPTVRNQIQSAKYAPNTQHFVARPYTGGIRRSVDMAYDLAELTDFDSEDEDARIRSPAKTESEAGTETDEEHDDDEPACMPMPTSAFGVPVLEEIVEDDEEEQEVDQILCDPTKLPRMTILDEDGFRVDTRQSFISNRSTMSLSVGSDTMMPIRPGTVIKSGLLFKQGFGFMNGGWKVRYAVLTSSKLTFYREENGRVRGEIDLSTLSTKSIEIMPRDSVFDGSQATLWRFAIKVKNRRVLISAYTEAEMKEWLRCLHVAVAVQTAGPGRFTDLVVPNGTLLADKSDGLMRSSGTSWMR
ncbi:hypothetical protein Poli38472_010658 [Pythium oligandrum]|uniref:PH domain-containing protein n=1 Tax=Pythium oligandrum TaxID=41045 RepID=A0A8K1C3E4_PYTOL|nr:hypothetical protein Poli38472_010658 [Pythium oligandrum]|eukprot:TMW55776.1 hypothetical protein Poli38472_010658 [Pythium oligandrum]